MRSDRTCERDPQRELNGTQPRATVRTTPTVLHGTRPDRRGVRGRWGRALPQRCRWAAPHTRAHSELSRTLASSSGPVQGCNASHRPGAEPITNRRIRSTASAAWLAAEVGRRLHVRWEISEAYHPTRRQAPRRSAPPSPPAVAATLWRPESPAPALWLLLRETRPPPPPPATRHQSPRPHRRQRAGPQPGR